MNLVNQLNLGVTTFFESFKFILKNNLGLYFLFPIALNIILFIGGWNLVSFLTDFSLNYVSENTLQNFPEWITSLLSGFLWIIFKIIFFLVYAYLGGFIVLILLSPVLAILSEKTDEIINNKNHPFDLQKLLKDILRGIVIAIRNMFYEIIILALLFIFSFIPLLGLISPILMFIVSAYFYGFSFIDYSNERNNLSIKNSIKLIRENKGVAIANGSLFSLFLLIPFIGLLFAGFAAIISTVAATIAIDQITKGNKKIEK